MKDLDFDELDRAVNSLMSSGQYNQPTKAPQEDDATVLEIDVSSGNQAVDSIDDTQAQPSEPSAPPVAPVLAESEPTVAEPVSQPSESPAQEPVAATEPTTAVGPSAPSASALDSLASTAPGRRSGRFMDIKPSTTPAAGKTLAAAPSPRPNRLGGRLEPVSSDVEATSPSLSTPISPEASLSGIAAPVDESSNGFEDRPYSPFVPNVQLEKRPLGNPQLESEEASVESSSDSLTVDNPEDQLPAQAEAQLPAELQSDLMSIESGVATETAAESPDLSVPTGQVEAEAPTQPMRAEPTSIPQQYATSKPASDAAEGDVFSADTYQQPLSHPGKSKSGWWTVLLIVLLIILGIAGGALVYLYVL